MKQIVILQMKVVGLGLGLGLGFEIFHCCLISCLQ